MNQLNTDTRKTSVCMPKYRLQNNFLGNMTADEDLGVTVDY